MNEKGSSPLARGLPGPGGAGRFPVRIIPARAGFTSGHGFSLSLGSDHPRSRGVYVRACVDDGQPGGSSPLARGLPGRSRPRWCGPGIIPARAGFTGVKSWAHRAAADHPRSRGVYDCSIDLDSSLVGSSPLARGLRSERIPRLAQIRIIPARAGFTEWEPYFDKTPRDHPRSRGVYSVES